MSVYNQHAKYAPVVGYWYIINVPFLSKKHMTCLQKFSVFDVTLKN
jgi:hypothetical protein